ncbi:NlpC/P60 family protein [Peteryoungia ipomoeae]|uniref:Peptidase n=1 Tax=Peteryoungia ipomoeae TaxID=1210932 RepID=A0A4S8PC86_9HYPH|nr:NlpC/P60 family protein [Peteryoungia ipomoeae]THV25809.1 peptidase [Peteryoungia ipomoeae]
MAIQAEVLQIATAWIGTPYRHQASTLGIGCDCLGLVRGIWRGLYGTEPEAVPAYQPDWAERSGEERLMAAAARHFLTLSGFAEAIPGDLVLFRFRPGLAAKHAGILTRRSAAQGPPDAFIHAYEQGAVTCSALVPAWRARIAGLYRFPERI